VGDIATISTTAFDPLGQMNVHGIRVYHPGIPNIEHGPVPASWSSSGSWVAYPNGIFEPAVPILSLGGGTADPHFDSIAYLPATLPASSTKTATIVLDAEGTWQFRAGVRDSLYVEPNATTKRYYGVGTGDVSVSDTVSKNVLPLDLDMPGTYPVNSISGHRLVGAYVNAGQIHRTPLHTWWQPQDAWSPKWGPNPVTPLIRRSAIDPTETIKTVEMFAGWGGVREPVQAHKDRAKGLANELMSAGVDFVAIDHTNMVFTKYRPPSYHDNVDQNPVFQAARALKEGFKAAAANPANRVKMTFMLGLTTAWYTPEMDGGNPGLEITSFEGSASGVQEYINARLMPDFNAILQAIFDEFVEPRTPAGVLIEDDTHIWQRDPTNGDKPLLLLYVGTNGPAFDRDSSNVRLNVERYTNSAPYPKVGTTWMQVPMTVTTFGGVKKSISEVFSIRWVGAFLDTVVPAFTTEVAPSVGLRSGGYKKDVRFFSKGHWQFRPESFSDTNPVTGGPLNQQGRRTVSAVHALAYRPLDGAYFHLGLEHATLYESPSYLMLTSWVEFGSPGDEPDPERSWTVMSNNKFGRHYADLVRNWVISFKSATP